eukprot:g1301.t1
MDFEDEHEEIFGELFGSQSKKPARTISPNRPLHSATNIHDESSTQVDSDDDFALPTATPSTPAANKGSAPTEAADPMVDGKGASSESGAGAGAGATPSKAKADEEDAADAAATKTASTTAVETASDEEGEPKKDQTQFELFPDPTTQRETYWDSITPEQLVWYKDCPALVVPERLHFYTPFNKPPNGVIAYGPSAKNVQPLKQRYVILQYLPLCLTCFATPRTLYDCPRGQHVEKVLPYNTIMAKKAGEGRGLGAEGKWADTDVHYQNVLKSRGGKNLTEKNWKASMDNAQMFLARALKRRVELEAQALEDHRLAEEELEQQRQEREREREEAGTDDERGEAGADTGDAPDAAPKRKSRPLTYQRDLPLAPGDRILYWDRTKRTGAADARMEATVLEIRTKKAARESNLQLLVLDNNGIVLDDWMIQRFVKDDKTGEVTVAGEGCMVKHHKLKTGKVKGSDPLRNVRMKTMIKEFEEDVRAYGAGDQLRSSGRGDDTESSDDESTSSIEQQSKKTTTKGKDRGSVAKKKAGGGGGGGGKGRAGTGSSESGGRGGSSGGSASGGRKAAPYTEEDEGDAMAAAIARKHKKKTMQPGGDGSCSRSSGGPAKKAKADAKADGKGAKKLEEASAGKSGGRGAHKECGEVAAPKMKKSKSKKEGKKEEAAAAAHKGAAVNGSSSREKNSGDGGGELGGQNTPVDLTDGGAGAGAGSGRGAASKPTAAKDRVFKSSLVRPTSHTTEERQGPPKKKPRKGEQQSKSDATGPPTKKARKEKAQQSKSNTAEKQQRSPKRKPEKKEEVEEKHRSKSRVSPDGGEAGSAGGNDDDTERKSATAAPAPKSPKRPQGSGRERPTPPRKARATATGASDGPVAHAAAETDWRVKKNDEDLKRNGSSP